MSDDTYFVELSCVRSIVLRAQEIDQNVTAILLARIDSLPMVTRAELSGATDAEFIERLRAVCRSYDEMAGPYSREGYDLFSFAAADYGLVVSRPKDAVGDRYRYHDNAKEFWDGVTVEPDPETRRRKR